MSPRRRQVTYRWRLREVMAARGLFATSSLVPLLRERGIELSASQVHRLVTGTPERLSLPVLAALCDILEVQTGDLIEVAAAAALPRTADASGATGPLTPAPATLPVPTRAHLLGPDDGDRPPALR